MRRVVLFGYRGTGKTGSAPSSHGGWAYRSWIRIPSSNNKAAGRSPESSAKTGRSGSGNGNAT